MLSVHTKDRKQQFNPTATKHDSRKAGWCQVGLNISKADKSRLTQHVDTLANNKNRNSNLKQNENDNESHLINQNTSF